MWSAPAILVAGSHFDWSAVVSVVARPDAHPCLGFRARLSSSDCRLDEPPSSELLKLPKPLLLVGRLPPGSWAWFRKSSIRAVVRPLAFSYIPFNHQRCRRSSKMALNRPLKASRSCLSYLHIGP